MTKHLDDVPFRLERILVPTSDYHCSYLLEVFEMGTGPIGTGDRHAVWLHHLNAGGYRWACSCGAGMSHRELDAALVAEARAHFDQAWKPEPSPIWHPLAIWTDRARCEEPPIDFEQLAKELASEMK